MPSGFLEKFYPILTPHTSVGQRTRKLGFSASHCLFWPIRGLGKIQYAQWIPVKILPHFDHSHLSVGQITRKLGFSASYWLFWPIRGLGKIQHAHWIPGKFYPNFEPPTLICRTNNKEVRIFSLFLAISANNRARKNPTCLLDSWQNSSPF